MTLLIFFMFISLGCTETQHIEKSDSQKPKSVFSYFTSVNPHPYNENVLIAVSKWKEYFKEGYDTPSQTQISEKLYTFNMESKKTEPFFDFWPGIIRFPNDFKNTDMINWDNFLADYMPEGNNYYEIGRFIPSKKEYIPMITNNQTANAIIVKAFTTQNLVFFYKSKRKDEFQDLWVMNLDGTNQINITNGTYVMVSDCILLDNERIFIDCWYEKGNSSFNYSMIYYPKQNKKVIINKDMSDRVHYCYLGIFQNHLVISVYGIDTLKEEIWLYDFNGNKEKAIYTFDYYFSESYSWHEFLFDEKRECIFFVFESTGKKDMVSMLNLRTFEMKDIFCQDLTSFDPVLYLNQENNTLYFTHSIHEYKDDKPIFEKVLHQIELNTFQDNPLALPDYAENCFSEDYHYVFSFYNNSISKNNCIIDTRTGTKTFLNKRFHLDYAYPIYLPSSKQFCFLSETENSKTIYFADLNGKVTSYPLWKK